MKVLLQRVRRAAVRVAGRTVGEIGPGLLVLLGVERDDRPEDTDYFADKTAELRIFPDGQNRMNRSVEESGGEILVVSQFTLAAATRRGRRPSFCRAAPPERAREIYQRFLRRLERRGVRVASGEFQATMEVELTNDGPVTILLEPPADGRTA